MIFKLIFKEKREFGQAKNTLHLLQSYDSEYDDFHEILEVIEISEDEAKKIMLSNPDYDKNDPSDIKKICLFDTIVGDDFVLVGSTDWD